MIEFLQIAGSKRHAADMLGINRQTVYKYLDDENGYRHYIRKDGEVYSLFARIGG